MRNCHQLSFSGFARLSTSKHMPFVIWDSVTPKTLVIFKAARTAGVVVMSKDEDFRLLAERLGPPPQILWITCGNTSNARLREILTKSLPAAIDLLRRGEPLVEISDAIASTQRGKRLTKRSRRPRKRGS